METRDILNYSGNKVGELSFPDDTSEEIWANALAPYAMPPISAEDMVISKIKNYKAACDDLLYNWKAANTLAGITLQQSADLLLLAQNVILALSQGMLPTAIYFAQQIEPAGFLTQDLKNQFIADLQAKL